MCYLLEASGVVESLCNNAYLTRSIEFTSLTLTQSEAKSLLRSLFYQFISFILNFTRFTCFFSSYETFILQSAMFILTYFLLVIASERLYAHCAAVNFAMLVKTTSDTSSSSNFPFLQLPSTTTYSP